MKKYFLFFLFLLILPISSYGNETNNFLCESQTKKLSPQERKFIIEVFKNRVDALITAEEIKALDAVETEENVINEIKDILHNDPVINAITATVGNDFEVCKNKSSHLRQRRLVTPYSGVDLDICIGCGYIYCFYTDKWLYGSMCGISVCLFIGDNWAICIPI